MVEVEYYRVDDFTGGLNDLAHPYNLAPNEGQAATNCMIDNAGALVRRNGRSAYGGQATGFDTNIIRGIFRAYCDQTAAGTWPNETQRAKVLISKHATKLYYGNDSTGAGLEIDSDRDFTTTSRMRCVQWGDSRIYIAIDSTSDNADDHAMRWGLALSSGTAQRRLQDMGVRTPTGTFTADVDITGAGANTFTEGWYRYGLTLTYGPDGSWGESLPLYAATYNHTDDTKYSALTLADLSAWAASYGAYQKKIYRTEMQTSEADANAAPLYYLTTQGLNATYVPISDASYTLDVTDPCPTSADTGDIPYDNAKFLVSHNSRLFGVFVATYTGSGATLGRRDRVYYSNLDMPDEWPAPNWIEIPGEITALASSPFGLFISTKNSIFLQRGFAALEGAPDRIKNAPGCVAADSVQQVLIRNQPCIVYAAQDGIYAFDGQAAFLIGTTADGKGQKIQGTWNTLVTTGNKVNARGIAYKHWYLLAYQDNGQSGGYNNAVLAYDSRYDSWWKWTGWTVGAWCVWDGFQDSGELYCGDGTSGTGYGKIYLCDTTMESCTMTWKSAYFAPRGPEIRKTYRRLLVELDPYGSTGYTDPYLPLTVNVDTDESLETSGNLTIAAYGASDVPRNLITMALPKNLAGKRVAVQFSSTAATIRKIWSFSIGYRVRGAFGI